MEIHILMVAFILGLVFVAEGIIILINSTSAINKGFGYYMALGNILKGLGFILILGILYPKLLFLAAISNTIFILGSLIMLAGASLLVSKNKKKLVSVSIFLFYLLSYYGFLFVKNIIGVRTLVISFTLLLTSTLIFFEFLKGYKNEKTPGYRHLAIIFFIYAIFNLIRFIYSILHINENSYETQKNELFLTLFFPVLFSIFWTDGVIKILSKKQDNPKTDLVSIPDILSEEDFIKKLCSLKFMLTTRESEIIYKTLMGNTQQDIADIIFVSKNTVKTHVRNIYTKLGVSNKTELSNLILKEISLLHGSQNSL
jgi:DNA-binding CsgD family transcriptional regulator